MANSLPKINLGKAGGKRNCFHNTCTYNSTVDFSGFMLPMFFKEMIPGSKLKVDAQSFIRLAPMPKPTFGRLAYHMYFAYQNIADLWMPFDNFMAGASYNTVNSRYIPEHVPQISIASLSRLLLHFGYATYYKIDANGNPEEGTATPITNNEYTTGQGGVKGAVSSLFFNNWQNPDSWLPIHALYSSSNAVTVDGADFVYSFNALENGAIMAFRFSNRGKQLRKLLMGLGYQIDFFSTEKVSILPLVGYFKSWYEIMDPKRTSTWTDTGCYRLLDHFRVNGVYNVDEMLTNSQQTIFNNWFLSELPYCFYTFDHDFISAHIANPAINGSVSLPSVSNPVNGVDDNGINLSPNYQPFIGTVNSSAGNTLSVQRLKVLTKIYSYINKKTVSGGKIDKFLRSLGISLSDDHSGSNFGSVSFPIQIGDVMATNATEFDTLGEYAGVGKGWNSGNNSHTFDSDSHFGFAYVIGCVVPTSDFVQGLNPNLKHIKRFDYFHDMLDGIGYQITKKDAVMGMRDVASRDEITQPTSLGLIPRYSEMKVGFSVTTGDLSLRSKRDDMLAYTLDRWITPTDVSSKILSDSTGKIEYSFTQEGNSSVPIASDSYRYFGKHEWMSNFNRIFYNESGNPLDDNFILHSLFDVKYYAPMKSLADSFETYDEEDDNGVISVQHS